MSAPPVTPNDFWAAHVVVCDHIERLHRAFDWSLSLRLENAGREWGAMVVRDLGEAGTENLLSTVHGDRGRWDNSPEAAIVRLSKMVESQQAVLQTVVGKGK